MTEHHKPVASGAIALQRNRGMQSSAGQLSAWQNMHRAAARHDKSWPAPPTPLWTTDGRRPDVGAPIPFSPGGRRWSVGPDEGAQSKIARRSAFTLIELLMVIIVIGILAGILLVALGRGTTAARNARVVTEINQLQTACETYRSERGSYPLTVGEFAGETLANQQPRIMRHVAKAFPRYAGNYDQLREQIAIATVSSINYYSTPVTSTYTNGSSDGDGGLDIANLDPAEAIVFWLGGIPDPSSETKLTGFRLDPASPFYDPVQRQNVLASDTSQQRSPPMFPFDPRRLVDYDQDGWYEYLPPGGTQESNAPPYVYFDSTSYPFGPSYPYASSIGTPTHRQGPALESLWGNCIPYAADPPGSVPLKFVNSTTFQLISAGLDNRYDDPAAYESTGNPWWFTPEYFPSGTGFQDAEKDNLTNFARGPIGDEAPAP